MILFYNAFLPIPFGGYAAPTPVPDPAWLGTIDRARIRVAALPVRQLDVQSRQGQTAGHQIANPCRIKTGALQNVSLQYGKAGSLLIGGALRVDRGVHKLRPEFDAGRAGLNSVTLFDLTVAVAKEVGGNAVTKSRDASNEFKNTKINIFGSTVIISS
jgi:hypothetical protein